MFRFFEKVTKVNGQYLFLKKRIVFIYSFIKDITFKIILVSKIICIYMKRKKKTIIIIIIDGQRIIQYDHSPRLLRSAEKRL